VYIFYVGGIILNQKLGFCSAIIVALSTAVFAFSMLIGSVNLAFGVCMLLSWAYILLSCSFAVKASQDRKAMALGGVVFACLYGAFINLVYYSQLTTVLHKTESQDIISALTYSPGRWMFNIDLLGYGMMAISTLLIGITILPNNKKDRWLKALLMIHGVFIPGIIIPMTNLFKIGDSANQNADIGAIILLGWCAYFIPVAILSAIYFIKD
jgi:hypothetical protein